MKGSDVSDAALLRQIQANEPGAFDLFVERFGDRIFAFGMRVCGQPEDASDVAQETLLKAYQSLQELQDPRAIRSWLYRVVSNFCLMRRRKGKFEPARELSLEELMPAGPDQAGLELPDTSHIPEDEVVQREMQKAVRAAIDELPTHYRVVLLLRDMEQLTTRETAEALDIPVPTVKMRLHRGRLMLRNRLAAQFGGGSAGAPGAGG